MLIDIESQPVEIDLLQEQTEKLTEQVHSAQVTNEQRNPKQQLQVHSSFTSTKQVSGVFYAIMQPSWEC